MQFQFHIYNHSNDGATAAIRAHQDVVRQLATTCIGTDENVTGRTLAQYISNADTTVSRPESFFRNVDILWNNSRISVPHQYSTGRRFRVTYSGNVRDGGGISFEGYCVVDPAWFSILLPMAQTPIQIDYLPGNDRDLIVVLP